MATTKASARTITTLPPTYTRKFVIFTPLRSVHHQKCASNGTECHASRSARRLHRIDHQVFCLSSEELPCREHAQGNLKKHNVRRWIGRTFRRWTFGHWTLDIGHWTLDLGRGTLDTFDTLDTLDTLGTLDTLDMLDVLDVGRLTLDFGLWTLDVGR